MKIVAFGDVHRLIAPDRYALVIEREQPDRAILVGDFFNDFNDQPADAAVAARWARKLIEDPLWVLLLGNHDLFYLYPDHPQAYRLRKAHTDAKRRAIEPELADAKHRFALGFYEPPFLFTHAGWSNSFAPFDPASLGNALSALHSGQLHRFMFFGAEIGGPDPTSGPIWAHPSKEMLLPGIVQVFGHTHTKGSPLLIAAGDPKSIAIGIDCREPLSGQTLYFVGDTGPSPTWAVRAMDGTLIMDSTEVSCLDFSFDLAATKNGQTRAGSDQTTRRSRDLAPAKPHTIHG